MPEQKMHACNTIDESLGNAKLPVERLESFNISALCCSHRSGSFPLRKRNANLRKLANDTELRADHGHFLFVLLGFVLALSNTKKNIPTSQFYVNRAAQDMPIYLIALLAYMAITSSFTKQANFLYPPPLFKRGPQNTQRL